MTCGIDITSSDKRAISDYLDDCPVYINKKRDEEHSMKGICYNFVTFLDEKNIKMIYWRTAKTGS